eukprot:NODE_461_length_7178_cov_0.667185.p7 type:complete len:151 gc:universal NODE_461_length_7178_cov_0.667185:4199-3747(-)
MIPHHTLTLVPYSTRLFENPNQKRLENSIRYKSALFICNTMSCCRVNYYEPRNFYTLNNKRYTPNTEIKENEGDYEIFMDAPGFRKEDISIEIKDDVLHVDAKNDNRELEKAYRLPNDVNKDLIEAKYENGVLQLKIGKNPEFHKKINIE